MFSLSHLQSGYDFRDYFYRLRTFVECSVTDDVTVLVSVYCKWLIRCTFICQSLALQLHFPLVVQSVTNSTYLCIYLISTPQKMFLINLPFMFFFHIHTYIYSFFYSSFCTFFICIQIKLIYKLLSLYFVYKSLAHIQYLWWTVHTFEY